MMRSSIYPANARNEVTIMRIPVGESTSNASSVDAVTTVMDVLLYRDALPCWSYPKDLLDVIQINSCTLNCDAGNDDRNAKVSLASISKRFGSIS